MSEWKEYHLSELADVIMGQSPPSSAYNEENVGLPFLQGCAEFGDVFPIADTYCTDPKKRAPENSVLISVRAPVGLTNKSDREYVIGRGLAAIVPTNVDFNFLYYQIIQSKHKLDRVSQGSTFLAINSNDLNNFLLDVPDTLPTQRKIARILSTADAVIEKTQAAIAKYKAIKQGMLHDLFTRGIDTQTGKLRPKYQDAQELYKESKLGWIPKEWEVLQINDCIDPIMSNVDKHIYDNEIKILLCNYMDVFDNRYLGKNISFSDGSVNASEMQRFSLKPQDVIITKDSETPDDIAVPTVLIENIKNLICGYHLCILRSKDFQKLNGEFLMLQLQIQEINNQFARKANGSTRYGLTIDAIEKISIKIPNEINEQVEIAHRLKTFENKIQTEQAYLYKLQQIKAGLMADLLSGRKKVNVDC